jgi:hypothetical protein
MTEDITQWAAGGLALRTIARWIIDGGDAAKMAEFVSWLVPNDVVQTEHLFIVAAVKRLVEAGEELSIDRLETTIAPDDPAGFVRIVLQNIVDSRHTGPSPTGGLEFDELVGILMSFRKARDHEAIQARRNAVRIARSTLARTTRVIDGARQLEWVEGQFQSGDRQAFAVFSRLVASVRDYPEGAARKHWAADALAQKDAERARLEVDAWPDVEIACKTLIDRWGAV